MDCASVGGVHSCALSRLKPVQAGAFTSLGEVMTRFVGTFALCCVLCAVAFAQSADPAFGIPPFSTVTGSKFDTIDLATSNVILTLPLRNKIGKMPFASGILGGGRMYQVPATPSIP